MKKTFIQPLLGGLIGSMFTLGTIFAVSYVTAAPTQAPPNGNPAFTLKGDPGTNGTNGTNGSNGAQGVPGTPGGNNCTICLKQCDFNGAGPCAQVCAPNQGGWRSFTNVGNVDGNDVISISIAC